MLFWYITLVCYIILLYCISILFFTLGQLDILLYCISILFVTMVRFEYQYIEGCKVSTTAVRKKIGGPLNHA